MADDPFATAPQEVIRYFREKRLLETFDWRDIPSQEHAFSFTVAKSMEHDILEDIRAAALDAVVNRTPYDQFAARLTPTLQAKGWWGRRIQTDPRDGVPKVVQLGSPRRLRTIYWANTPTAHAAGEWERTERNKRFLPFLLYTLSRAERRRPEHEGWVGIILPVDDPWWDTHYPPNGWGCQCGVRQISEREARRLGWTDGMEGPQVIMRPWRNKRSGETVMVPLGIDPGWATNPGKARARNAAEFLHGKIAELSENRRRIAIADIVASPALKALAEGRMPAGFALPVAQLPTAAVEAFDARTATVHLSADSVAHILHERAERGLTVEDFRAAISVISAPEALLRGDRGAVLVGLAAGKWWRAAVKSTADGREWWLVSFHRKSEKAARDMIERARKAGKLME